MIRSRITFIKNSQSSSQHLKSGEHCFHRFLLFHSESLILLEEGKSFCLLDLSISFVSHLERIVDGLRSFFCGDLLILVVRDGVEKNGSGFMMIQKLFLLGLRHLISGNDLPFSILRMFIALNNNIPEIFIKAKKKTFYPILPIVKFLTIKDGRFCTIMIVSIFRGVSHMSFSHTQ